MNQTELIAAVAERAGLTKADAGKAVEALVGTVTDALKRGGEVRIAGFGSVRFRGSLPGVLPAGSFSGSPFERSREPP